MKILPDSAFAAITLLIILISLSSFAEAAQANQNNPRGVVEQSKIDCGISRGCTVYCGYWDYDLKPVKHVQEIYMTIYENGMTKLELIKKNLRGAETVLIGPKSYFCNIENP